MSTYLDQESDYKFDVVLVGDNSVGKAELLNNFGYSKDTVGHVYITRTIDVNGNLVQLHIWNVSSHDSDFPVSEMYTRGASGAILVYDVTCRDSFERIHKCFSILDPETIVLMLGNTCNATGQREVTKEEGEKLASDKGIRFLETNVINKFNVDNALYSLARDMLWRRQLIKYIVQGFIPSVSILEQILISKTPQDSLENLMFCNMLRSGEEETYRIRVMLVGNECVGKSTLLRRLLRKPVKISKYDSTNGIDVHIHSCDVDLETGKWYVNESHEAGVSAVAKLRSYFGSTASATLRNETTEETSSFHVRVAKIFTNMGIDQKIDKAQFPMSSQTGHYSKRRTDSDSNVQTTMQDVPKTDMSENCNDSHGSFVSPVHTSIDNDDIGAILAKIKSLEDLKETPKAKVDFYDFAGQLIFHASHPTFLSSRAIYIMTFNLNQINLDRIAKKCDKASTNKYGKVRQFVCDMDSFFFWLNTVYMFTASKPNIQPHVILVGTHADKLPKANRGQVADMCFREIRSSLADSPLRYILSDEEFAVDNTKKTDPCSAQLQTEILKLAQLQPWWGKKTPSRWLPLDREIQLAKNNGLKVLSIGEVRELNIGLEVKIPDEDELEMFLQYLHDMGEILYFNEPTLRDFVVLDPVWLIDALKALITADRFAIRSPQQANKWKRFCETGIINKSTIVAILKETTHDSSLFENSEHVLRLMEKFLFIASPIDIIDDLEENRDTSFKKDTKYIVPSMVQTQLNTEIITSSDGLSSTTVLCLVSKNNFLPSAVFHKLLAKCISKWQIVDQNGQKQIFSEVCKFNLDQQKHYKMIIVSIQHAVHVKIISYIDTGRPRPVLCKRVHEFLVANFRHILTSMGFSEEFRTCIQCPKFSPVEGGGYLDTELMDNQEFMTCDECKVSHVMQTADLIDCWTDKGAACCDEESIPQTHISTKDSETSKFAIEDKSVNVERADFEKCVFDSPITQGHLNHARVCNALVTVCAEGLRDILLSQIPPPYAGFYQLLLARKPVLTAMRNVRQEQIGIMFPDSRGRYTGTVDQFDITLLYTLIRNISSVAAPMTGWGNPPTDHPRDTSLGASTERIRMCRNCVSGHSMDGRLDDQAFEHYWKEICSIMDDIEQSLGEKGYQDALKNRKYQILSPAEAQSLRSVFSAFQAEVLSAVKIVTEKMRTLQTMVQNHN